MIYKPQNKTKKTSSKTIHFKTKLNVQFAPELTVHFKLELGVQFGAEYPLDELNRKYNPNFNATNTDNHIILATTNNTVNYVNDSKLKQLDAEIFEYKGVLTGEFPKKASGEYDLPTDINLQLKVGAQVMLLKNTIGATSKHFNGKIGKIESLKSD